MSIFVHMSDEPDFNCNRTTNNLTPNKLQQNGMSETIQEHEEKLDELGVRTDKIKRELNETFVQVGIMNFTDTVSTFWTKQVNR